MQNNVLYNQLVQTSKIKMFSIKVVINEEDEIESITGTLTPKDVKHIFDTNISPFCIVLFVVPTGNNFTEVPVKIRKFSTYISMTTTEGDITGLFESNTWTLE